MKYTIPLFTLLLSLGLHAANMETTDNRFRLSTVNVLTELSLVDSLIAVITNNTDLRPPLQSPVPTPAAEALFEVDLVDGNQYPFTKGTIPRDFTADCAQAVLPTLGHICSDYGIRRGRMHSGVDLKLSLGDPVVAAFPGVVRFARNYMGYGKMVVVAHPNGLETVYSHLSKIETKVGQRVAAGQLVGLGGRTGRATTTHLHFEVRIKGRTVNPSTIFDFSSKTVRTDRYVHKPSNTRSSSSASAAVTVNKEGLHVVRQGDTLGKIARAYGVSIDQLCELNKISRTSMLRLGQKIVCSSNKP